MADHSRVMMGVGLNLADTRSTKVFRLARDHFEFEGPFGHLGLEIVGADLSPIGPATSAERSTAAGQGIFGTVLRPEEEAALIYIVSIRSSLC
jgi:hypothetical protein